MSKIKVEECSICGGQDKENLIFVSDGDESLVRHSSPFQCILVLRNRQREIDGRTAHLVTLG